MTLQVAKTYHSRLPGSIIVTNDVKTRIACPYNVILALVAK